MRAPHLLLVVLVLALAACSQAADAPADVVRVGAVLPAAGVYAQLGPDILDGMDLYLDEVGRTAAGRTIELQVVDETTDPQTALERTRRLVDGGVDVLTGYVSTASAYAVRDLIDQRRVPTVVTNAGGNDLTRSRRSEFIYRASFTSQQVSAPLGTYVAEQVGTRAAIIAADYAFGQESAAAFRATFEAAGGTVVEEIFTPLGSSDFSSAVVRLADSDADAVYGFLSGSDAVIFLRQRAEAGLDIPLHVAGFMVEPDVLDVVGADALGARSSLHWAPTLDNDVNVSFVESFTQTYGRQPTVYAVQGYDGARVIVEAIEATGGDTEPTVLAEAIGAVEFDSPRGRFRFDPGTNQVVQHMYLREVVDGPDGLVNEVVDDLGEVGDPEDGEAAAQGP